VSKAGYDPKRAAAFDREIDDLCSSARSLERQTVRMCRALPGWREGRIEEKRRAREQASERQSVLGLLSRGTEMGEGMKVKTVGIDADVEGVLRQARLDGDNLCLQGQLPATLYKKVMKVAELLGFKWNRKLGCHVGAPGAADALREALSAGKVVDEKKTYQFFETPKHVAERLASLAGIKPGDRVLEPSAGKGAIIRAIQGQCPHLAVVFACELNPQMASDLSTLAEASRIAGHGDVEVSCGDFLQVSQKYDRIVMNPPFTNGQDVDHVRHAYDLLLPGGRLVSVMSPSWRHNSARKFAAFREWLAGMEDEGRASVEELPAGTFKESGTDIATVIVVVQKPLAEGAAA